MLKYIVMFLTELQENPEDSTVTLSQRAYIIAKSLSELKASALVLLVVLFLFLLGVTVNTYLPPTDIDKAKVAALLGTAVGSIGLIWYYIKARQLDRNLNEWKEDHLEQAYYLVFDTTIPKGDTTGEKILNLALAVFPELRSNYIPPGIQDRIILYFKRKLGKSKRTIVSESMNYKVSSDYSVDLALRIPDGYFIVKDFKDKVLSVEDLKYLVKILSRKFREIGLPPRQVNIFRLICVAQEYDQYLERETLENKMRELKTDFGVDLLIQDKVGYSVLWVG